MAKNIDAEAYIEVLEQNFLEMEDLKEKLLI
jgi:hypothetical protein